MTCLTAAFGGAGFAGSSRARTAGRPSGSVGRQAPPGSICPAVDSHPLWERPAGS